jgi:hypothetical protein
MSKLEPLLHVPLKPQPLLLQRLLPKLQMS